MIPSIGGLEDMAFRSVTVYSGRVRVSPAVNGARPPAGMLPLRHYVLAWAMADQRVGRNVAGRHAVSP